MAFVAGAAAVEAAGVAVDAAGVDDAAFSGLLQAARAQAKAAAERTTRYFFMLVHHQNVRGKTRIHDTTRRFECKPCDRARILANLRGNHRLAPDIFILLLESSGYILRTNSWRQPASHR
ncbi:MAG: hypothetical protein ACRER9_06845 [Gammaproteobacteria bacterium]